MCMYSVLFLSFFLFLLFENHMYCVAEMMNLLPVPRPWQSGNHVRTPAPESRTVGIETVTSVRPRSLPPTTDIHQKSASLIS
jgi:hypothetical protein